MTRVSLERGPAVNDPRGAKGRTVPRTGLADRGDRRVEARQFLVPAVLELAPAPVGVERDLTFDRDGLRHRNVDGRQRDGDKRQRGDRGEATVQSRCRLTAGARRSRRAATRVTARNTLIFSRRRRMYLLG